MKKTGTTLLLTAALLFFQPFFLSAQKSQAASPSSRPIVTDISASPLSATRVTVSWKIPADVSSIKALLLFRGTQPFASKTQLDESAPAAKLKNSAATYVDTLTNYKEYYYAVIALLQDGNRYDIILPSINATVNGVRVARVIKKQQTQTESAKEKLYADGEMREQPLPYLDMIDNQGKTPGTFSKQANDDAKEFAGSHMSYNPQPLDAYVFEEDIVSPTGGDDYYLFEVLRTYFVRKKYAESATALQKLLSVNRSAGVTQRATFYLGEARYFCGDYPAALSSFLQVEDSFPVLSEKWIESTLTLYKLPSDAQ
jgi:TolA-binding protein